MTTWRWQIFTTFHKTFHWQHQGKKVTCKKAEAKQGKVYVGKLPAEGITDEDIQNHFAQFGAVAEVVRPIDKMKNNEPKNFCFVTFEKEETAKQLVKEVGWVEEIFISALWSTLETLHGFWPSL